MLLISYVFYLFFIVFLVFTYPFIHSFIYFALFNLILLLHARRLAKDNKNLVKKKKVRLYTAPQKVNRRDEQKGLTNFSPVCLFCLFTFQIIHPFSYFSRF